jgi:type II secretory pathway pseudopilin PulG
MIVIMAIMAIFLTIAVETVSFQQRREKEEELIFRGNQAVEAVRLFRARNGRFPLSLAELVKAKPRVLRKVWVDPITGKTDWVPVFLGEEGTIVGPGLGPAQPVPTPGARRSGAGARGPIIGVHSASCEDSIKVVDGRTRYCDWKFFYDPNRQRAGPGGVVPTPTPRR